MRVLSWLLMRGAIALAVMIVLVLSVRWIHAHPHFVQDWRESCTIQSELGPTGPTPGPECGP